MLQCWTFFVNVHGVHFSPPSACLTPPPTPFPLFPPKKEEKRKKEVLFTLQVNWSWCYKHMVTGPFLFFSTGWLELVLHDGDWDRSSFSPQVDWNWCYRHTIVTRPFLVFTTGWLDLVLQTHDGHRNIPCFLHGLTGIGVTDTRWSQDHSLFSPQAD